MRILLYFNEDLRIPSGISRFAEHLASILRENGHTTEILGANSTGLLSMLKTAIRAFREGVRPETDLVLLSQLGSPFNGLLSVAIRLAGKPLVYVCMDPPVEILPLLYPSMPLTRVLTALLSLSERLVNWACAATLSVSSGVDELLRGRGWQKPILRFYNIHGTLAAAELPDPAVRSESGWDDATIVVYAGALQPGIRGIEEQLRAIARIPPEYNVRMLLVGHGPGDVFHPLIKSLGIEERVRFLGSVDPKRLSAILSACDTAVFKSLSYALPSKVFEYVAHGLRIVSMEGATDVNVVLGRFVTTYDGTDEGLARALASPSSSRGYTIEDARQHLAALREESRTSLVTAVDIASRASHSR